MHNLVPQFILERLAEEDQQGTFTAVGLFIDISGFTQLMETLMQHGQHGAEVMASVMLGSSRLIAIRQSLCNFETHAERRLALLQGVSPRPQP